MTESYDFVKEESGEWFIVLPDYPGEKADLQMVMNADVLLDHFLEVTENPDNKVNLTISDDIDSSWDYVLDFIIEESGGGIYHSDLFDMDVWLCQVTSVIFGYLPKSIYFSVNSL